MQWLRFLLLGLVSRCSFATEQDEQDIMTNIACSVYDFKLRKPFIDVPLSATLKGYYQKLLDRAKGIFSHEPKKNKKDCEKCVDGLGCWTCQTFGLEGLPADELELPVSRNNLEGPSIRISPDNVDRAVESVENGTFLNIIVHGYGGSAKQEWITTLKDKILQYDKRAVITIDWQDGADSKVNYMQAVRNSQLIGRQIASLLYQLMNRTSGAIHSKRTHLIGLGLGAQMAIFFWDYFRLISDNYVISKITALDPSKAYFEDYRLHVNTSMARFVEVIHTSAGRLPWLSYGMSNPVGHVDFYMNGGSSPQPGCEFASSQGAACSSLRAALYYIEAVDRSTNCTFDSFACIGGLNQYLAGNCDEDPDYDSTITLDRTQKSIGRGVQIVETNDRSPFCKPQGLPPVRPTTSPPTSPAPMKDQL
ncbi:phospholipase A1 2 [Galendromus occidentalis]|uniref:Phospholipase A1 2 n=1 Tax=Galendromus occidentalis TaxID=34638 RepID=A0AAJ7SDU6_9ACAR|nr:phospholipase A1 2 [Galendromus occidentalis]